MRRPEEFDSSKMYMLDGRSMRLIVYIALKLFREERMSGDAMRDAAQSLEMAVADAEEVKL